jgi:hypothetical protein
MVTVFLEVSGGELLNGLRGPIATKCVRVTAVEKRLQDVSCRGRDLIILGLDGCKLGVLLSSDLRIREGRVGNHIGKDLHA